MKVELNDPSDPFSIKEIVKTQTYVDSTSSSVYDGQTKKWTFTSPEGRLSSVRTNSYEQPVEVQVGLLAPLVLSYGADGKVKEGLQAERKTKFEYDSLGFIKSVRNALGQVTRYNRDSAGRITSKVLPDKREIYYEYDKNGNLLSVQPSSRPKHSFLLTAFEELREYFPPALGGVVGKTEYKYNRDKQLSQVVMPSGEKINYKYHDWETSNLLESITIPDDFYAFDYDWYLRQINKASTSSSGVTTNRVFLGPLISEENQEWDPSNKITVQWVFDDKHRVKRTSVEDTQNQVSALNIDYDKDDLVSRMGWMRYKYDDVGSLTKIQMDNTNIQYTYDQTYGELIKMDYFRFGGLDYFEAYQRDRLGRIVLENKNQDKVYYSYDISGRLISKSYYNAPFSEEDYRYDSNGNRVYSRIGSETIEATYDAQDRLTSWGDYLYTYDENGALASKLNVSNSEITTYDYDVFGNLREVELPNSDTIEYGVDGFNRRIFRKENGTIVSRYIYEDQLRIAAELSADGELVKRFLYNQHVNVPDQMIYEGERYIFVKDVRGSVLRVVHAEYGDVMQELEYDTWGRVMRDTNPGFQPFGFAGGVYDAATGLTRFGARDYDAEVGRWTSKDPIRFDGGDANLYGYILQDPVNGIDPNGTNGLFLSQLLRAVNLLGNIKEIIEISTYCRIKERIKEVKNKCDMEEIKEEYIDFTDCFKERKVWREIISNGGQEL